MTALRHVLLPALRVVVWAAIAVALLRLAFGGPAAGADPDPMEPGAVFTDPVVEITRGTVTNTVELAGTVVADPAVTAAATMEGVLGYFAVADAATVANGDPVIEIRQEMEQEAVEHVDDDGSVTMVDLEPLLRHATVVAPAAGVVELRGMLDQPVSVGDVVLAVDTGGHTITAPLSAEQQYRLLEAPAEATVTVNGGPAPFTCTDLLIGAGSRAAGGSEGNEEGEGSEDAGSMQVSCAVPADVTVFAGLSGTVTITAGEVNDVLLLPVTAVQGSYDTGNVWLVPDDGEEPVVTEVGLGLGDGEVIEVTQGLAEGDTVLEFIPVLTDEPADGEEDYADDEFIDVG